ncbi:LPS export ABC transporter permease LptG [Prosthecochloris sp. CIB 2401]|uniref:LPS export ABC transporter permease LptG n=1 Tax=Prosthecochloris sp. CIB 2401 TaxID=1868325 RepID=UPI00080AA82D|nr:LPS export ABC transporter permease LptG [Prosthecochloris sp. CIB 2401]ANT65653.1 lipopolysaccharide ABC transporter permease [Prosthecochloris sp. CIB 2401]
MTLLDRYIGKQFLVTFSFAILSFLSLFIVLDLVENIDRFLEYGVSIAMVAGYYANSIPEIILLTSPVAVLLSSLYITGRLAAQSELSAIFAAGVSLGRLLYPFAAIATLISLVNLVNTGWILPISSAEKSDFLETHLGKNSEKTSEDTNIHILESSDRIITISDFDQESAMSTGVTIETFSSSAITERIDAEQMYFDDRTQKWILEQTTTRTFLPDTTRYRTSEGKDTLELSLTPASLREYNLRPEEMNIVQHYTYIRDKRHAGFPGLDEAIIALHSRITIPLASLIIILIGVPLSTRKKRSGLALEAGVSIFIGFLYLGLQKTLSSVGDSGALNPILAAWIPNIIFLATGLKLYRSSSH